MIGGINLRQARFLSDAYAASSLDSIDDYPEDSASSLGFPPGSYHTLRHTFATELLNAGMRIECLHVLLGHKSIEETRRYARLASPKTDRHPVRLYQF
jgi:site-specific recombinase XerD